MVAKQLKLLAIVGTTASGKTGLAVAIAKKFNGEVIAADSRTVYKYLDIGTAKPTLEEQQGITHWGLDIVGPGERYSAAQFQQYAKTAIADISSRGKLPILVGGSGLYIDAVLYDYSFAPPNAIYREQLMKLSITQLRQLIIESKLEIPENSQNKRYLIRTLERGKLDVKKQTMLPGWHIVGLSPSKEVLKDRVKARAKQMVDTGVIDEIKRAYELYPVDSEALQGGIYKSFWPFLNGAMTKDDTIDHFVISDMQLAKKQNTWFRRNKQITWFSDPTLAESWISNEYGGTL